ncbi:MAG: hypothetical protein HUU46_07575 [Candidatus Hydrogenedentes bacterium]|nr:hypothetical protein [Candidatus Hydrogenedentota bacterium]
MTSTKIDLNCSKIARIRDLDELAAVLFPGNKSHQKTFLAIFVELKWSDGQFLRALEPVGIKHGITPRTMETVRAKMRRLGFIDHVSRFNKRYGYREGWVFSNRFDSALYRLAETAGLLREQRSPLQERKDRDALKYLPN